MRRRDLLAGILAATASRAVRAVEPGRAYRLVACTQFGMDSYATRPVWKKLSDHLTALGYVEGKNLIVTRYSTAGQSGHNAEMAAEIVRQKPDVIALSFDHELIAQVAKATSTIPIVAMMGDPVAAGLVRNIARPEANVTGIALDAGIEMQGKHLELLAQAVPSAKRVAYLSNRAEWEGAWGQATVQAGQRLGIAIVGAPMERAAGEAEYRKAFDTMAQASVDALMFNGFSPNWDNRDLIAQLAMEHRLPSICWWPELIEKGQGLMAYAPDYDFYFDRFADQVGQILNGARPADLPIYQPTKFILAVSLKTAKALGLQLPVTLLASADEVIE
jgi:putative tryptophan/tyrosine transport system substrate-binding protein